MVLGLLTCRRATATGTAGEVHLVAGAVAAAVDIEHVALLERAIGAGRAEHHRGFGVKVRAAFDIIPQHVFLDRRHGNARTQMLEGPMPGYTAEFAGLAHPIDFPLRSDQAAPPHARTGIDQTRLRRRLRYPRLVDHRPSAP